MSLPITPSHQLRLRSLRSYAPETAKLAQRLSDALKPEALLLPSTTLEADLFGHLEGIGLQKNGSITRLGTWLYSLAQLNALQPHEAAAFLAQAANQNHHPCHKIGAKS